MSLLINKKVMSFRKNYKKYYKYDNRINNVLYLTFLKEEFILNKFNLY